MDAIFQQIETWYNKPFGSVLDAGTGENSLRWLCSLPTNSITAITGDPYRKNGLEFSFSKKLRQQDRILHGNWNDNNFLMNEQFDIVIADYLLGAIDGFAPYFQDQLFGKLKTHMKNKLYIVGLEPYPQVASTNGGKLILDLARLRDACILLAKHRCYREYPMQWVCRNLQTHSLSVRKSQKFPIRYTKDFVMGQLDVCKGKLNFLPPSLLREGIKEEIRQLEKKLYQHLQIEPYIPFGFDYLIEVEHVC